MTTDYNNGKSGTDHLITENCTNVLDCLGNSCRRQILQLLVNEPHYVSQIAKILDLSQPAVLKQMNILKQKGLVIEKKGSSIFTREKAKGPEPNYFQIARSFYLSYILTPFSVRERIMPLPFNGKKIDEKQQQIIDNKEEFADKINYLNNEIAQINNKTKKLEDEIIDLEMTRLGLLENANELIIDNDELKKDTEDNYMQRVVLKKQICEDKSCVEEIERLLISNIYQEKIPQAMKDVQDKQINLNIVKRNH
jgi:ArsR family transcriptional regulator